MSTPLTRLHPSRRVVLRGLSASGATLALPGALARRAPPWGARGSSGSATAAAGGRR